MTAVPNPQTAVITVDVGAIMAAMAPTLAILITAWYSSRRARRADVKLDGIHVLVNDQLTREKASRLSLMKAQRAMMESLFEVGGVRKNQFLMDEMDQEIATLEAEITKRDEAAASIARRQV